MVLSAWPRVALARRELDSYIRRPPLPRLLGTATALRYEVCMSSRLLRRILCSGISVSVQVLAAPRPLQAQAPESGVAATGPDHIDRSDSLTALYAAAYSGRAGRLEVRPPRQDAAIVIDGLLDEPVWRSAAVLAGFTQRPIR